MFHAHWPHSRGSTLGTTESPWFSHTSKVVHTHCNTQQHPHNRSPPNLNLHTDVQLPLAFLWQSRLSSHYQYLDIPHNLSSLTVDLTTHFAIFGSSVPPTCPNQRNTLWSTPVANTHLILLHTSFLTQPYFSHFVYQQISHYKFLFHTTPLVQLCVCDTSHCTLA